MTVLPSFLFIIVSPDLELDCACHGKCLVKIKCLVSVIGSKPDIDNYKHLEHRNGVIRLMKTNKYYYQIQGLTSATTRKYANFCIHIWKISSWANWVW